MLNFKQSRHWFMTVYQTISFTNFQSLNSWHWCAQFNKKSKLQTTECIGQLTSRACLNILFESQERQTDLFDYPWKHFQFIWLESAFQFICSQWSKSSNYQSIVICLLESNTYNLIRLYHLLLRSICHHKGMKAFYYYIIKSFTLNISWEWLLPSHTYKA